MTEKGLDLGFSGSQDLVKVRNKAPGRAGPESQLSVVSPSLVCTQQADASTGLLEMSHSGVFR